MGFTTPASRAVHLCGARLVSLFASSPRLASAVIIHEELHSLGLGENPPTSLDITQQVLSRCGR